ncbi:hypothetical protein GOP47_0018212 [Adiantum capillus-veneris]|uniref:C3H1-type domain-containing protein n=1 Tax=Adiantum capillus-veneris TaxID=13818 RepID=A0A9D4Z9V1_ADICA|nr:hypothetical protein GOP47_0017617 [Adiantum capillus-veneris]KAI5067684.1 hypothetical protein GOP47_0018212 [Adiantum capillus-veneris]
MYRPGGDGTQFRPVPAAPPPPRVMGGPFISPPPSLPPPGHPPLLAPPQGRPPIMQQPPILQQYSYPPPAPQPPPPVFVPPPVSLRSPVLPMHPSLPSMQSSLPSLQRPLPPQARPNLVPSLPPPRPLVQQPPLPMQAGFQSMSPSLPLVHPVSGPFQSPLVQVAPPMSFMPAPLPSFQPAPFLPPLPPCPPLENPPPPPPASPPPPSPPLPHVEESLRADLLPPEPPKPTDPEVLKNIDVLAAFVVKNGPRFESMARARQAGDPKFAFLFESDAEPEAAVSHEFYKWKKKSLALELGLEVENKKNSQVDAVAAHAKGAPPLPGDIPASPAMSDMDMEDDFTSSPVKEPMRQLESRGLLGAKGPNPHETPAIEEGHVIQKNAAVLAKHLAPPKVSEKMTGSSFVKAEEQKLRNGSSVLNSHDEMDPILHSVSNCSGEKVLIDSQSRPKVPELLQDSGLEHQEHRALRLSRWESLSSSVSNQAPDGVEDRGDQNAENSLNLTRGNSLITDQMDANGDSSTYTGSGTVAGRSPVQENGKTVTVDEFGRLVQKEAMESESEDDMRPRKRRRSYSRSRSRSSSRGRSRSRSRNRNRSRSRSRSRSYSSDSRGKRQVFSRSPPRRGRWSRSRSRSPHWQRNNSQSPLRDRWGGAARGDRDWRSERESYGRGRRGGRSSGPAVCFHYARGRCFRGSACKFLHPERETGQERGVQLADGPVAGSKNVDPTTNRPLIGADPVLHVVNEGKVEHVGKSTVSTRDRTDDSQAVNSTASKEGKLQAEQPALVKDSQALSHGSDFEKIEQSEKTPGEHLETGKGADEPVKIVVDNDQLGLVKSNINSDESLEEESTNRDIDANLKISKESEEKAIEQNMDARNEPLSHSQHSELEMDVIIDKDKVKLPTDSKKSGVKAENLDSSLGFEEITPGGSAEGAVDKSEVETVANLSRTPLISGAPDQGLSPVSSSPVKVLTNSMRIPSSPMNENLSNERSVHVPNPSDPVRYSSPAGSHVPNLASTSVSTRSSFPSNSPSVSQQMPISNPPVHGTPHNQFSHVAAILPHRGPGDITRQQPDILPQDRLLPDFEMHGPAKFFSNHTMLQQLGNRPHSAKEPWDSGARFSLSKEETTYSRVLDSNSRQYARSGPLGDGSQHAYPLSNIGTSPASVHNSLPWIGNTLAASRSTLSSNAEHYSYTLTTIPPLPSHLKLPGGSNLPNSSEQYDPLSDSLELGPSGTAKSSSKPSGDGRSIGTGFLENLSPGLDGEKGTALALATDVDTVNMNEAAADVGVVENVSPPGEWSPVQPGDVAIVAHDYSKSKKSNRGLKLLRTAVADRVKVLLKPAWKEGRLSKDAFKTIAKKAVEKVTGNLPSHHIPKSQEKVDQFMSVSSSKISKLVQGYIDKYSKV